ncbi:hypothetical protein KIN20_006496 [Parelaphostrongylus tenuis]|uniref:Protection of telomeres protein 1 ssDNA-binding domain-containing protein n=1 Tax=Parelaphostrongylus tenuis TaxID=148309 RepID=A0AAD5M1V8_PARTN|nr:hypothetical protein KIN20_006496 [Parelaphostrongylus tenuis]
MVGRRKHPEYVFYYFNIQPSRSFPLQKVSVYEGSKRAFVLRVWDGREITPQLEHFDRFLLNDAETVFPPAEFFNGVPESYFIDVMVFGEWITRASALKSGSIVVLKNVHSYKGSKHKIPVLTLHEGKSHGRDIIEISPDVVDRHYRLVKLKNDIAKVILSHKLPDERVSRSYSAMERSDSIDENEHCNGGGRSEAEKA